MFQELEEINSPPAPFQFYTAEALWNAGRPFSAESMEFAVVAKKG
jgi:hypothetical protein